jgi:glycosyltransferase involved in cell wall biosynthesis
LPSEQLQEGGRGPAGAGAGASLSLAYIGRIARETGIREVVYGLRLARERGVLPRLVIAGSGEDEAYLRSVVERLDLTENVDFPGPVFADARLRLLRCVDLSVLPRCGTGLLQTLHYSLLAGVPVIAARAGSASDAIVDKVHGLLLPSCEPAEYGDAMCRLAFDRALLAQMRDACRAWQQGLRPAA